MSGGSRMEGVEESKQRRGAVRCLMRERLLPLWALRGAGLLP